MLQPTAGAIVESSMQLSEANRQLEDFKTQIASLRTQVCVDSELLLLYSASTATVAVIWNSFVIR